MRLDSIKMTLFLVLPLLLLAACSGGGSGDSSGECSGADCEVIDPYDEDGDGLTDACDSDPSDSSNSTPTDDCDSDNDGHADVSCSSYDADGNGTLSSSEYDSAGVLCDNCIGISNASQSDKDGDGQGDHCDCVVSEADDDADCVADSSDNCPEDYNYDQTDSDKDGSGDECDDDDDGDNVADSSDNCTGLSNSDQTDADADGTGDACDTDRDGDCVTDATAADGTAISGGTDSCPTEGVQTDEIVTGTDDAVDSNGCYEKWTGCCFDTDGDDICDDAEASRCVNNSDSGCTGSGDTLIRKGKIFNSSGIQLGPVIIH